MRHSIFIASVSTVLAVGVAAAIGAAGAATISGSGNVRETLGFAASAKGEAAASASRVMDAASENVTLGTETYRGFTLDNVLRTEELGDIHFNLYVPDTYDASAPCALFVTLPGYQGLYFQGVGENLRTEDFGFEAQSYDPDMIVVAPQLDDWGQTSADMTIELVEYLLGAYSIDPARVYIEGYSGGGETLSRVMSTRPDLFAAALFCSSQWDGDLSVLADARVPLYLVVGESDEYYGSDPARSAAEELRELYRKRGLSEQEIGRLVVLDIKDASYYAAGGVTYQHAGGGLIARDRSIMGWLFGWQRTDGESQEID